MLQLLQAQWETICSGEWRRDLGMVCVFNTRNFERLLRGISPKLPPYKAAGFRNEGSSGAKTP
jgi:hypothetical protein